MPVLPASQREPHKRSRHVKYVIPGKIGATGFEPATFRPPAERLGVSICPSASRLSYAFRFVDDVDTSDDASGTKAVLRAAGPDRGPTAAAVNGTGMRLVEIEEAPPRPDERRGTPAPARRRRTAG